jgi:hypothetical protein
LAVILVVSFVSAALVGYVFANSKVISADADVRRDVYEGDGAIKAAINWAKTNPDAALDDEYFGPSAVDDCMYQVPSSEGGESVSVTCDTPDDEASGVPADQGQVPPEALLLLGARHNEPGPYSFPHCAGGLDGFLDVLAGWFGAAPTNKAGPEQSLLVAPANRAAGRASGSDNGGCNPRTRLPPSSADRLIVNGRIVAHGKIANGSTIEASGGVAARYGGGSVSLITTSSDHGDISGGGGKAPEDTDPGRVSFNGDSKFFTPENGTADLNIRESYLPVGFNKYGALRPGYSLPIRTTAFEYDPAGWAALPGSHPVKDPANLVPRNLVPLATCSDSALSQPIIFLPGRYTNAGTLNKYTSNSANINCYGRTIWFAPDAFGPGADAAPDLLNARSRTGAFLFDFTEPVDAALGECGVEPGVLDARWCVGGSMVSTPDNSNVGSTKSTNPRVVVGWPEGWDPFVDPAAAAAATTDVTLGPADTFTNPFKVFSFLNYWHASGGTLTDNLAQLDGSYARFEPCNTSLWNTGYSLACPVLASPTEADGRTGSISGFSGVVGAPIEQADAPRGRVNITLRWGYKVGNDARVTGAKLMVHTLGSQGSTEKLCVSVPLDKTNRKYEGAGHPADLGVGYEVSIPDEKAKELANNCGTEAELKRLRVSFVGQGQNAGLLTSSDNIPTFYFDGVRISYSAPRGASFPLPSDPTGIDTASLSAKSDCDPRRPGGQLIFNGDANVYVTDGSLEVCAGPYPDDPSGHQAIGLYGVPALESLKVGSDPVFAGSYSFDDSVVNDKGLIANASSNNKNNVGAMLNSPTKDALQIGEPIAGNVPAAQIRIGCGLGPTNYNPASNGPLNLGDGACGHNGGFRDARVSATMEGYSPPPGYRVKEVSVRLSIRDNGKNNDDSTLWNTGDDGLTWPASWSDLPRAKYCADSENAFINNPIHTIIAMFSDCRQANRLNGSALYVGAGTSPILAPTQFESFRQMANSDPSLSIQDPGSFVVYRRGSDGNAESGSRVTAADITNGASVTWATRVYCPLSAPWPYNNGCQRAHAFGLGGLGVYYDYLDGVELDVVIEPDGSTPGGSGVSAGPALLRPQSGCITAHPNYEEGRGMPDCALVRVDNYNNQSGTAVRNWLCRVLTIGCDTNGLWVGRVSVKGTIYAPSSAMEVDAVDVAYPLATRGVILRHLRLSGWETRGDWDGAAISNEIDTTPSSRVGVFTACRQEEARRGVEPCDRTDGDVILTTARVRFEPPVNKAAPAPGNPSFPIVESWTAVRRASS